MQEAVNTRHVHLRLGYGAGATPPEAPAAEVASELRGADGSAADRGVARDVPPAGEPGRDGHRVLSRSFQLEERHRGLYLRLAVNTGRGWLTEYLNGRVLKRWPSKLVND